MELGGPEHLEAEKYAERRFAFLEVSKESVYPRAVHCAYYYDMAFGGMAPDTTPAPPLAADGKPVRGPDGRIPRRPLTKDRLYTCRSKALSERTQERWVEMVGRIEDENLRRQVAKKVWWDYFSTRKWSGLDHLIYDNPEDPRRTIIYVRPDTAPYIKDVCITLWQMGYTPQQLTAQYPARAAYYTFTTIQDT